MVKIFGRELAVWLATLASVWQVFTAYGIDRSGHFQGISTAIVVFVFAVAVAIQAHDGIIALVTGIATALFSLFTAFGLDFSPEKQTLWLGVITMVLGFFVRTQVTSPVPADVSPAGKLVA